MFKKVLTALQVLMMALYASDDDGDQVAATSSLPANRVIMLRGDGSNELKTFTFKADAVPVGFLPGFVIRQKPGTSSLEVIPWSISVSWLSEYTERCTERCLDENVDRVFDLIPAATEDWARWVTEFTNLEGNIEYWGRAAQTTGTDKVVVASKTGVDAYNTIVRGDAPIELRNANTAGGKSHVASLAVTPLAHENGAGIALLSGVFDCNNRDFSESLYGNAPLDSNGLKGYLVVGRQLELAVYGGYEMVRAVPHMPSKL